MRKNVIVCDRCGKEFPESSYGYKRFGEWTDYRVNGHDWDFCKECRTSFLDWLNNRIPEAKVPEMAEYRPLSNLAVKAKFNRILSGDQEEKKKQQYAEFYKFLSDIALSDTRDDVVTRVYNIILRHYTSSMSLGSNPYEKYQPYDENDKYYFIRVLANMPDEDIRNMKGVGAFIGDHIIRAKKFADEHIVRCQLEDKAFDEAKTADSKRADARTSTFDLAGINDDIVLFSDVRVDRKTVPEGIYMYEIRHTDEDWGEPCEMCDGVLVNFYGTILSKKPFDLEPYGILGNRRMDISFDDNFTILDGACTLQEYIDGTYKLDDEEDGK